MNCNQIRTLVRRYTNGNCDRDRCLYDIGIQASLLVQKDVQMIQGGKLTSKMRSDILAWLRANANAIGLTTANK